MKRNNQLAEQIAAPDRQQSGGFFMPNSPQNESCKF